MAGYLEMQGDIVSGLIVGITGVITRLMGLQAYVQSFAGVSGLGFGFRVRVGKVEG